MVDLFAVPHVAIEPDRWQPGLREVGEPAACFEENADGKQSLLVMKISDRCSDAVLGGRCWMLYAGLEEGWPAGRWPGYR
jgi:hypothetical protein